MRFFLLFLLSITTCFGQLNLSSPFYCAVAFPSASGGAAPPSYLVIENCDGTGTPSGWTDNATPAWDYTTSPAPLEGTQSVNLDNVGDESYFAFTGVAEAFGYFMINVSSLAGADYVFSFRDSSDNKLGRVRFLSDGAVRVVDLSGVVANDSPAGTVTINTTYHIWPRYKAGSGANSEVDVYVSATSTKPGSPAASINLGTGTANAARFAIEGWSSGNFIFDKLRADDVVIGSNPP